MKNRFHPNTVEDYATFFKRRIKCVKNTFKPLICGPEIFCMALLEKKLVVKTSTIPDSGMGLFTEVDIPKGTQIVEYKGRVSSWKEANHDGGENGYIFFVNRNHVIDARRMKSSLARYANDARGLRKVKGLVNNAEYEPIGTRVFIKALRNIPAGSEIFVSYGKEYWETIRENIKIDAQKAKDAAAKKTAKKKK